MVRKVWSPEDTITHTDLNYFESLADTIGNLQDKSYVHDQILASASWTIIHNLGKYPAVGVVDSAGTIVVGEIDYISTNEVRVRFTAPFSGKAYLN